MNEKLYVIIALLILTSLPVSSQNWKTYPYEPEGSKIKFPQDEGRHPAEPVEWWYTMGHLKGAETGTNYSYMLTYFYMNYPPYQGFRIFNVTNDDTGEFYSDVQPVAYALLATDSLNLIVKTGILGTGSETWKNKTNDSGMIPFEYILSASAPKGALNLEYIAQKPPLILGDDGYFLQGGETYTYYYSQTLNNVTGTFTFNGTTEAVTGTSWIDRQYGTFNPSTGEKYEWFCLQLSNGMDINIWDLFTSDNTIPDDPKYKNISVYVDENNSYTNIDFHIERLGYRWTSAKDNCFAYKWRLTSTTNNIDIIITAPVNDEIVTIPYPIFFQFYEGSINIEGTVNGSAVTGKGYAELLHSYDEPQITMEQSTNNQWNNSIPVTWTINNPDDGNPLLYNLYYSNDNKQTFTKIDSGISVNEYYWNDANINAGDSVWFKVNAYSVDTTLTGTDTNDTAFSITSVTGLSAVSAPSGVNIYPVPVHDKLYADFDRTNRFETYIVYDLAGNRMIENSIANDKQIEINIEQLNPGFYMIQFKKGKIKTDRKFIKY